MISKGQELLANRPRRGDALVAATHSSRGHSTFLAGFGLPEKLSVPSWHQLTGVALKRVASKLYLAQRFLFVEKMSNVNLRLVADIDPTGCIRR